MDAKVERLEDNKDKVTATVPASEVDAKVKRVYKDLANRYSFPGFRKGKAPRKVIDNALGKETALAQATEDVVNDAYPLIIEELRLYPVGQPDFSEIDAVEPGKDFTITFTVGAKPEVTLTSYEPLDLEVPPSGVTDDEIDSEVEYMTRHYETYEEAPDDQELDADGYADIDVTAKDEDGNEIDILTGTNQFFSPGGGLYSEAFENELFGLRKGDEKTFTLDVPEDEDALLLGDQAGKKVTFDVKVIDVKRKAKPELTDEWVSENLHFDSLADLRDEISKSIQAQKDQMIPRIKETVAQKALRERVDEDVPEYMVEEAETNLLQEFFTQLQQQGMTFDGYLQARGIDSDQFKLDIKAQAEDEAKEQLALDAWAREKGIDATDEEILAEFEKAGVEDPQKSFDEWRSNGRLYLLREGIVRANALKDAVDGANVTEVDLRDADDADSADEASDADAAAAEDADSSDAEALLEDIVEVTDATPDDASDADDANESDGQDE